MVAQSLSEQWDRCKESLREALEPEDAVSWLPSLRLAHIDRDRAVLAGVPNAFFHKRIQRQFAPLLRRTLQAAFPDLALPADLPVELRIGEPAPATPAEDPTPDEAPASTETDGLTRFIAGPENGAALTFCRQVADAPGGPYNPLYLVGATGLGKTHLLEGIAARYRARGMNPVVTSGERFMVAVLDGIRERRMHQLRERYRQADALLVDDLPALANSVRAQEELHRTFVALHEAGRQLVFAGDVPPGAVPGLSEALRSRLEMGLQAELHPPGPETRRAILAARVAGAGLSLSEHALERLAHRITRNPRRLEAAIVRLAAHRSLLEGGDGTLDDALVERITAPLHDPEPGQAPPVAPRAVLDAVAGQFGIGLRQLKARERSRTRNRARRTAMLLLRDLSGLSHGEIGTLLGNRSHSTIVEGIAAMRREASAKAAVAGELERLRQALGSLSNAPISADSAISPTEIRRQIGYDDKGFAPPGTGPPRRRRSGGGP